MTPKEFVGAIRQAVFETSSSAVVLEPRGHAPHPGMVETWDWYSALPERDQTQVRQTMRLASWSAIFGMFAVLDGVRAIDNQPHGHLELTFVDSSGARQPLNDSDGSNARAELHDLWNAEVFPPGESIPGPPG